MKRTCILYFHHTHFTSPLVQGFNYEQSTQEDIFQNMGCKRNEISYLQILHLPVIALVMQMFDLMMACVFTACHQFPYDRYIIHCYVKSSKFLCWTDIQQKSELHTWTFGSNQHSNGKHLKYHFKTQPNCL